MAIFAGLFLKQTVSHWLEELEKAGVPCGPVNDFAQVFADKHVRERGMEIKVNHPLSRSCRLIRNPITFSETPVKEYRAPPLLGQDTREVLASKLGYDDAKLDGAEKAADHLARTRKFGVIGERPLWSAGLGGMPNFKYSR